MSKVSIYFFTGDFVEAIRRYDEGIGQVYQAHNEVLRLIYDLRNVGYRATIYSFVTPEYREYELKDGSRIVDLGAQDYSVKGILDKIATNDRADTIIAHFPSIELLQATLSTGRKVFPIMATSYNRRGLRARLHTWRLAACRT